MRITNERIGLPDRGKPSDRSIKKIAGKVRKVYKEFYILVGLAILVHLILLNRGHLRKRKKSYAKVF
jgi:hypothetical protein